MRYVRWTYGIDPTGQGFFWPDSLQKRKEWLTTKRNNPVVAESVYQCNPGARQGVIFLEEDMSFFAGPPELRNGMDDPAVRTFIGKDPVIVQAWDTAFSATPDSDHTVCVTGLLVPCSQYHRGEKAEDFGPCEQHYDVYVLDVFRERIAWGEVTPAARRQFLKWRPQTVVIEKRAYGVPLIENLTLVGLPIEAVEPIQGKTNRVLEGVGAGSAQGWFKQHRVRFAAGEVWVEPLVRELKDFTGEKGATDDQVDALVHLIQYAIRTGSASTLMPEGWRTPEEVDRQMFGGGGGGDGAFAMLLDAPQVDMFEGYCGRCDHYKGSRCKLHNRGVSALHSCGDFKGADATEWLLAR